MKSRRQKQAKTSILIKDNKHNAWVAQKKNGISRENADVGSEATLAAKIEMPLYEVAR
jgi:hypothetical protein